MREDIEQRLHRVKIDLKGTIILCPLSQKCEKARNCLRCNRYFEKCSIFNSKD